MFFGGKLGLSCLALAVVLFVPVFVFVIRRKWRLAVARREEIKRLLVLASEEAARAELDATAGYGVSVASYLQPLQFQCAVCFFPTTTRCARCKAVRYCTGKCQIIHWRQGHKEECRPFTATHKSNEMGSTSSHNAFEQEGYDSYGDNLAAEGRFAKPVEQFEEDPTFSNSCSPKVAHRKGDITVEHISDGKTNPMSKSTSCSTFEGFSASSTCSESSVDASVSNSTDSDGSDGSQSTDVTEFETDRVNVNQNRPSFLEHPILVNTTDSLTKLFKLDQIKIGSTDRGAQRISSSSSSSKESLFPVPSTSSSGFWERTIDYRNPGTDAPHNSSKYPSSDRGDSNMSNPGSSLSSDSLGNTRPPMDLRAPYSKTVILDNAGPTASGIKKSIDKAVFSEESRTEDLKPRKSGTRSSIMSDHIDVDPSKDSPTTMPTDLKRFSFNASADPAVMDRGLSVGKDSKKVSTLLPLKSERSNNVVNDTSSTSHSPKSQEVPSVSKSSDVHLPSSSGRNSALFSKPVKVDDDKARVSSCSSDAAGHSQNVRNGFKTSMSKVVDHLKSSKLSRHYPLGAGSEIAARQNKKVLFPYELFVKLYNWKEVELRPCGLINCGNSCYANAVLQCLAFTPPLSAYLLQGLHSKACEKTGWCFTCEFESLVLKAKAGNSPLSPIRILSQIQNIGSHLANGRQEDAHEFLRYAIDIMQSVCLKEAGAKASDTLEEETTLIGLTFGGYLRSKIQCMKCGGKSERHERMMDLTVEIDGDIGTLEEALRQFTGTEILDGENKYQCSRCKSYERAKKKLTVLEAPNVLTIALKRFQSGKFGKINKSIRFPEILDLAPYMSGTSYKSSVYRLYGVVVHLDIMNAAFSGHYVCYVRNIQNKWFKIDDSTVKAVELERVLAKGAYMLLYSRCSPRAPRSITNTIVPRDPSKPENPAIKSRRPPGPRDVSVTGHANSQTSIESLYPDHPSFQPIRMSSEDDCSSDNSSSIFSEASSCSTESSNRDLSSTEDYFDQIFGDLGRKWNNSSPWRNSSDSETSSSPASSPSPMYSSHSSGNRVENGPFLCRDETEHSRKVVSSSSKCSCRETDSDRLGRGVNPLDGMKSGVLFRRSSRERTV